MCTILLGLVLGCSVVGCSVWAVGVSTARPVGQARRVCCMCCCSDYIVLLVACPGTRVWQLQQQPQKQTS